MDIRIMLNINGKYLSILVGVIFYISQVNAQTANTHPGQFNRIQVHIKFSDNLKQDSLELAFNDVDYFSDGYEKKIKSKVNRKAVIWTVYSEQPILIDLSSILGSEYKNTLCELGDSLVVSVSGKTFQFSGIGYNKQTLLASLENKLRAIEVPDNSDYSKVLSVADYTDWVNYVNKKETLVDSAFNLEKNGLSLFANNYLKAKYLADLEYYKIYRFALMSPRPDKFGLKRQQLTEIFEKTFRNSQLKWLHSYSGKTFYTYNYYEFARQSSLRKVGFDFDHPSVTGINRTVTYYNEAKRLFRGSALQNCLTYIVTSKGIKEYTLKKGYMPEFEAILADYYRETQDARYTNLVKAFDKKVHNWLTGIGTTGYNFSLPDSSGKLFTKESFRGKLLVLNFWNADCTECEVTNKKLSKVQQRFKNTKSVVFINVSSDKDKEIWLRNLKKQGIENFGINVFTAGLGLQHPVLRGYNVSTYPTLFLYDGSGKSLVNPNNPLYIDSNLSSTKFPYPNEDEGEALMKRIESEILLISDGPYVFYKQDSLQVITLPSSGIIQKGYKSKRVGKLSVQTDQYDHTFPVSFKKDSTIELATYEKPDKLIALSDIEGNFDAFRKLLQINGVIDSTYNWTFGKGHLVFGGDMFDRGQQVTECLWLMYSLEEKARASGGYIHFVLGNHEIMNLQGDHRYVDAKYERSAKLIGKTLTQLYGENSELGRWLRTKNVVEKIGDLLFCHGGISPELNKAGIEVAEINKLARPNYAVRKDNYSNGKVNLVMSATYGPFWYRGYYPTKPNGGVESLVDSVLNTYNVKHIVTGHTIIADTISSLYNSKVINTDTRHAKGKSEALLVEGNSYYRVNDKGQRWLLFRDPEDKPSTEKINDK